MGWEISEESYAESRDSLLNNFMLLTMEVAEVAEELRRTFNLTDKSIKNVDISVISEILKCIKNDTLHKNKKPQN
jgi:hypothetical protein